MHSRYLAALALVEDPTPALCGLDDITVGKAPAPGRSAKAFNPIAPADSHLFGALLSGDHIVRGFANRDRRDTLRPPRLSPQRQPASPERAGEPIAAPAACLRPCRQDSPLPPLAGERLWRPHHERVVAVAADLHRAACQGRGVSRLSLRRKKR